MKITFITGAANGLGCEFARLYANDNNNLLLVDKDEQGLAAIQKELQQLMLACPRKRLTALL